MQLIMVIPITKQRLDNCLVAFMFVAVFNSLLFMVRNASLAKTTVHYFS
jgi:hypothetical protein